MTFMREHMEKVVKLQHEPWGKGKVHSSFLTYANCSATRLTLIVQITTKDNKTKTKNNHTENIKILRGSAYCLRSRWGPYLFLCTHYNRFRVTYLSLGLSNLLKLSFSVQLQYYSGPNTSPIVRHKFFCLEGAASPPLQRDEISCIYGFWRDLAISSDNEIQDTPQPWMMTKR